MQGNNIKKPVGLLELIRIRQAQLERLGLPEHEARKLATQLAKHKLGIE